MCWLSSESRKRSRNFEDTSSLNGLRMRKPFNDEVSSKFLDRFLDSLDSQHIYFLQSDLKEFEKYRTTLDELTIADGDTSPARVIFTRFLERLGQQYEYATNVLEK